MPLPRCRPATRSWPLLLFKAGVPSLPPPQRSSHTRHPRASARAHSNLLAAAAQRTPPFRRVCSPTPLLGTIQHTLPRLNTAPGTPPASLLQATFHKTNSQFTHRFSLALSCLTYPSFSLAGSTHFQTRAQVRVRTHTRARARSQSPCHAGNSFPSPRITYGLIQSTIVLSHMHTVCTRYRIRTSDPFLELRVTPGDPHPPPSPRAAASAARPAPCAHSPTPSASIPHPGIHGLPLTTPHTF